MTELVIVEPGDDTRIEAARGIFAEYQRELGVDLCFQSFEEELATLPGKYSPPEGVLMLLYDEGCPVACGALRPLEDGICELKRIYVRPEARRKGIARAISQVLINMAQQLGYQSVRLDTLRRLPGAVDLYTSLGFSEIEPYNFNPEPDIVYMERHI